MAPITTWGDVADIPIHKPSKHAPRGRSDGPSDDDMGFNDPGNIIYVNMEGQNLGERFKSRMEDLEQMLQLTHQLATIHAGLQVRDRKAEGVLPTDDSDDSRWRRSQYRARVLDTYYQDGVYPWMFSPQGASINQSIDVEKSQFHWQLLSAMLTGILLPRPVADSLEEIFKSLGDTIRETKVTQQTRSFWSILQTLFGDMAECLTDRDKAFRNLTYTLDQEMHTVTKTKSTQTTVRVRFHCGQNDYSFNERTWRDMRPEVERYIRQSGIGNITNPPTVPV